MFAKLTAIVVVFAIAATRFVSCAEVLPSMNRDVKISYPSQFIPSGQKYYFVGGVQNVNWTEATGKCRELGAKLATVESGAEREALRSHLYNNDNLWNMYWLADNGRATCPFWRPVNGWYYANENCAARNYWICETYEPMMVAHRVWTGAI